MTDRYIDLDETQIYGPHASGMIRTRVIGLLDKLDGGLEFFAGEIDGTTQTLGAMLSTSREASAEVRGGTKEKGSVLAGGVRVLGRFSTHLASHPDGAVDRKTFFPEDGTAGGVGRGASRVLLALGRIATELKKSKCEVSDKKRWLEEVSEAMTALAPLVQHSNNAKTERRAATPELAAAREAWLQTYMAAKSVVEGVLRLTGNLHMMPTIFHDMAVPGTAKITEAPPVPPPEPAQPTPAGPGEA